mgnify:FL=1
MTNFEFSQQLENDVKKSFYKLHSCGGTYIDELFGKYLVIEPKPDKNSFVVLNIKSQYGENYSGIGTKISNIQFHQREAIILAIETAVDYKMPETAIELIGLAVKALLKLYVLASISLTSHECVLLYYLHTHDAYGDMTLPEETVFDDIKNGELELTESEYKAAVSNLLKIKSVSISDARIKLNEKVILKY